jgi:hypothetical protein
MTAQTFSTGPALRGGFTNPLFPRPDPGVPLRAIVPRPLPPRTAAPDASDDWAQFPESLAATVFELKAQKCAPCWITWMPRGVHVIRPNGAPGPVVMQVMSHFAEIANRHLGEIRAKAARGECPNPHFDYDHAGGFAGEVLEFDWAPNCGVRAHVAWSEQAESDIVAGRCKSFSPHWINAGSEFLGIRAECGALLSSDVTPAFRLMPAVLPWTRHQAMNFRADTFIRRMDRRAVELRAQDVPAPVVEAFEAIKIERPDLHAAYALREAIQREIRADFDLQHCAT